MAKGDEGPSEYEGIAAQFAKAKALKEQEEAQGLKGRTDDSKKIQMQRELQFKASHGLLLAFFSVILLLHILGIYLFTSGFLLTRLVLDHKSTCAEPPIELSKHTPGDVDNGCWHPKTFDKAVVIIVDALRYDFTVPFIPKPGDDQPHHFHNKIPVFFETARHSPNNAFLLPFIADPPTTTLQRLKGLTTGTLPTFIDAGSNFAGTAIDEDNLVAQLRNASKKVVHLGDDTWHSLFPGYFEEDLTHAYDSFNVWDLHTVDNGVIEHLFPLLHQSNTSKWDVIFGHFLGVDHAGHRYGPDHPGMSAKLQQMDDVFRRVIQELDEDTLLVVMGDHGMDSKGDHGGESDDEIEAALWMYSKKPVFDRSHPSKFDPPPTAKTGAVAQIDLVPTLALLLGLPIPFNNLGKPIEEAFIGRRKGDFENLALVNRLTAAQIHRYQAEYTKARSLDDKVTAPPRALWDTAEDTWKQLSGSKITTARAWKATYDAYTEYERETLAMCRSLWARFDVPSMLHGIEVLAGTLVALGIYARGINADRTLFTPVLFTRSAVGLAAGAGVGTALAFTVTALPFIHTIVYCTALGSGLGLGSAFWYARLRIRSPFPTSLWGWMGAFFPLLLSIGFAANSFTIWEDEILLFYIVTFGIFMLLSSFRQDDLKDRALGIYHSFLFIAFTRLASLSRLCREEQMPFCKSTYYASATSSTSAPWQLLIPFFLAVLLPGVIKAFYNGTKSYQGSAQLWVGFALRVGLLLSAIYWALDAADDGDWISINKDTLKTIKIIVAQVVLGVAFGAGYSTFAWSAPLLNISTETTTSFEESANGTGKPSMAAPVTRNAVTILGYANVHGSRYLLLLTIWLLPAILVSKPMGGGTIGLLTFQIFSLFEILDTNKLTSSSLGPTVLALLGSFYYFKTGHQATLSSIQWESAFIPLRTIRYPWSPLLVILNTFAAPILTTIAVPATVLWKQPPKKAGLLGDVAMQLATYMLVFATIQLCTTVWAMHLRRHLMLYRVFSPRWMVGSATLLVVDVVGILVALGGVRWSFGSVAEVFGWS